MANATPWVSSRPGRRSDWRRSSRKARAAFIDRQVKEVVKRTGKSETEARRTVERWCEGVLHPDVVLPFDDPDLAGKTVADTLADPDHFEGETLADPLEGVDYGRCKAKVFRRGDGTLWINSFAHGGITYELKLDAAGVRRVMEAAAAKDVVAVFVRLALEADLDAVELAELRQLAKKLSGVVLSAIDAALTAAQQQQAAQARQGDAGAAAGGAARSTAAGTGAVCRRGMAAGHGYSQRGHRRRPRAGAAGARHRRGL